MVTRDGTNETLHQQILSDIEGRIVSGEWPPGFRLPFEVDLARSYDVSRMTVNKVLTKLAGAGLIERRKKLGSFVSEPRVQSAILEIHDVESEVRALNRVYRYRFLQRALRNASKEERVDFALGAGAALLAVTAVHDAETAPFCLEERLINLAVVPEAKSADFRVMAPGQWLRSQVPWSTAEHKIYATAADTETAGHLHLKENAACLVVERRTWNERGAVTRVRFTYPAGKHALVARFTPSSAG